MKVTMTFKIVFTQILLYLLLWGNASINATFTASSTFLSLCDSSSEVDFELQLKTDNYGSETSWTLSDEFSNVIQTGDGYASNSVYNLRYNFIIEDSLGDGICTSYGEGSYRGFVNNELVFLSNGSFSTPETKTFIVENTFPASFPSASPTKSLIPRAARSRSLLSEIINGNCDVYGIECENGNVDEINLYRRGLSGTVPTEVGTLSNLEYFDLSYNNLSGNIPTELGELSNLELLELHANELSGTIPSELGALSNLSRLDLINNELSGTIPTELGELSYLESLSLASNDLTGTIPTEVGGLSGLKNIYLVKNDLRGTIPTELGGLSNLRQLFLNGNQLSGTIPTELGELTSLQDLWLINDDLSGTIPTELGGLPNLRQLYLRGNNLSGTVPQEVIDLFGEWYDWNYYVLNGNEGLSLPEYGVCDRFDVHLCHPKVKGSVFNRNLD